MRLELIQTPEDWQLILDGIPVIRSTKLCTLYKIYLRFIEPLEDKILRVIGNKKVFMKREIKQRLDDLRDFDRGWHKLKKEGIIEYNFNTKKWSIK